MKEKPSLGSLLFGGFLSDLISKARTDVCVSFLIHSSNIVLVSNQRDAAIVLPGLLSLYMFRTRFASIFRSNTQNCNGSHQCVSMRVG